MRYSFFLSVLLIFGVVSFFFKHQYFTKSLLDKDVELFISSNMTFNELCIELDSLSLNLHPFAKLGRDVFIQQKRLDYWFLPGRYVLKESSSFNEIINKIRSRSQDAVNITFNSMDDVHDVFGILDSTLELDSIDIINFLDSINFPLDSLYLMLIPNTYEIFWNISPRNFLTKMELEYDTFWNIDRLKAIKKHSLSKHDVFILASIIDKEASHVDEMPKIAGLYLNRLKKGWPLAADPTIIYIWNKKYDKMLRRVRHKHIEQTKSSLFNTYHNKGLPPFPICLPSFQAIESVVYPEKHDYLYMCAKPDYSEYHNFAKNHFEHQSNAAAFHTWLNTRKIY